MPGAAFREWRRARAGALHTHALTLSTPEPYRVTGPVPDVRPARSEATRQEAVESTQPLADGLAAAIAIYQKLTEKKAVGDARGRSGNGSEAGQK